MRCVCVLEQLETYLERMIVVTWAFSWYDKVIKGTYYSIPNLYRFPVYKRKVDP